MVGLGALGLPMAINLQAAGYSLRVHTRSRSAEKDPGLAASRACATPAEAASSCEALLLCVSDDAAVEAVLWGCLLYTSPSPRDRQKSRMPSSA